MRKSLLYFVFLPLMIFLSCSKSNDGNQVQISEIPQTKNLSVIVLLADGLGVAQLTATWDRSKNLQLERFPFSGLVKTQSADKFVTESGSSATSMFSGHKTNYGYLGIDADQKPLSNLYSELKEKQYKTGIITSSFIADASLAAIYYNGTDRYEREKIALSYIRDYPDFCVAGGRMHFDERSDGLNLLDSLSKQGVQLFYEYENISSISHTPAMGLLYPFRAPYLSDGRNDFLKKSSLKALDLFKDEDFFLYIESALIDIGGHDNSIEDQIEESLEMDEIAGLLLDFAQANDHVLLLVVSDHESGSLTLLQDEGMNYTANYAYDEHSGVAVPIFAYGPGAENFSGLMDNTDIYWKIKDILNQNSN